MSRGGVGKDGGVLNRFDEALSIQFGFRIHIGWGALLWKLELVERVGKRLSVNHSHHFS
jgi:hypothetical protein